MRFSFKRGVYLAPVWLETVEECDALLAGLAHVTTYNYIDTTDLQKQVTEARARLTRHERTD